MLAGQIGARGRIRTDTGDVLDVVPLRWATRAKRMEPPVGVAPTRSLYKRNPQAAAWRRNTGLTSEGTWFILFMIKPILLVLFDKNQTLWFNSLCL